MNVSRDAFDALLYVADGYVETRYNNEEWVDIVLYCGGSAFHLVMERNNKDSKIILTSVSYSHADKLM